MLMFFAVFSILFDEISGSRISVVAMTGAAIAIDNATSADSILSVKQRIFAINRKLPVHRQRLMYRPGPRGITPLADDETLGGAGVARDGTAELDVLLADLPAADAKRIGEQVRSAGKLVDAISYRFTAAVLFVTCILLIVLFARCRHSPVSRAL